jgi:4-hydroxybenzoyl-CoA thioesterase
LFTNTRHRVIAWGGCDPAGIGFNPGYVEWLDTATAGLFAPALGMIKAAMVKRYGIVGIPLVDTRASFRVSCAYGDEVRIASAVIAFRRNSFDVRHCLPQADGTLAVEGFEARVWVRRDPDRPGGINAQPIPEEVTMRFAALPPSAV